jgi:hypothetical protein
MWKTLKRGRVISLKGQVWAHETSLTLPLCIAPNQECKWKYIYAINFTFHINSSKVKVVTVDMLVTSSCTVNGGLYSHNAEYPNIYPLPKAINHKLFKNSLHMEVHFELLEEKNPLISVDLKPQNSYELSRKYGVILLCSIIFTIVHTLISSALFLNVIRFLNSNKFTWNQYFDSYNFLTKIRIFTLNRIMEFISYIIITQKVYLIISINIVGARKTDSKPNINYDVYSQC